MCHAMFWRPGAVPAREPDAFHRMSIIALLSVFLGTKNGKQLQCIVYIDFVPEISQIEFLALLARLIHSTLNFVSPSKPRPQNAGNPATPRFPASGGFCQPAAMRAGTR